MRDSTFFHLFSQKGEVSNRVKTGRAPGVPNSGGFLITNNETGESDRAPILAHVVRYLFGLKDFKKNYAHIQAGLSHSKKTSENKTSVYTFKGYTFQRLSPSCGLHSLIPVKETSSW